MAYAIPMSGDDLPRRRRVAGRTSTLQLGEDDASAAQDDAPRRAAAPAYPAEPAGGGYFGPDPTPGLSQKERLAAERKVRGGCDRMRQDAVAGLRESEGGFDCPERAARRC